MAVKEAAPRSRRINPNLNERLDLLEEQNRTREPDLVPVRHGRMMASPFSFYRGSARIMAADQAGTPLAGLGTQLCGNARLSNLSVFASPGLDTSRYFYWRCPRLCGWTLARPHARSGDPVATAQYLAGDDAFDHSFTDFCERYAEQNEQDYEEFVKAVRSGRLEAVEGV